MSSQIKPGTQGTAFNYSQDPGFSYFDVSTQDPLNYTDFPEFSGLSQVRPIQTVRLYEALPGCMLKSRKQSESLDCETQLVYRTQEMRAGTLLSASPTVLARLMVTVRAQMPQQWFVILVLQKDRPLV